MGKTFNMVGGGGGTNVVANPAMTGTEINLQGLEVNGTKYKVPLIRPNLLDNAYFVGGGSQQGGGQFPINQKGQTTYIGGSVYGADRWCNYQGYVTTTITNAGLSITRSAGDYYSIFQSVENVSALAGKKVTASMLATGYNRIRLVADGTSILDTGSRDTANEFHSATVTLPSTLSTLLFIAYTANAVTTVIKAVKLELGDTQTLAHNEGTDANPVWVLNEIPNYTEELWKCQRYYQLFASSTYRPTYGEDYRPPMRLHSPTKGTISIGGTTYYYADANI